GEEVVGQSAAQAPYEAVELLILERRYTAAVHQLPGKRGCIAWIGRKGRVHWFAVACEENDGRALLRLPAEHNGRCRARRKRRRKSPIRQSRRVEHKQGFVGARREDLAQPCSVGIGAPAPLQGQAIESFVAKLWLRFPEGEIDDHA